MQVASAILTNGHQVYQVYQVYQLVSVLNRAASFSTDAFLLYNNYIFNIFLINIFNILLYTGTLSSNFAAASLIFMNFTDCKV